MFQTRLLMERLSIRLMLGSFIFFLESKQHFSDWVKTKIVESPFFQEEIDYILLHKSMMQNGSGGHNKKDYALTQDTAKKVSMSEQTSRG